jgi:hypothetical protein
MIEGFASRAIWNSCFTNLRTRRDQRLPAPTNTPHIPFGLSHPLANQITTTNTEKRTLRLCRNSLRQETLTRPRRSVEQDPAPRGPFPREEVGEFDGEDDGFFEGFFCLVETCDVGPLDVGCFRDDCACDVGQIERPMSDGRKTYCLAPL